VTAWFNLAGLITVLAAINVGTFRFAMGAFYPDVKPDEMTQLLVVSLMTASQALINHRGISTTRILTDFSGYWILLVATVITLALLFATPSFDTSRLITFSNFSGLPEGEPVWPRTDSLLWLFALGLLLPAYTLTGFDASAHVSEETTRAARNVPRGIVRSVWVSGLFGWLMLCAVVLAMRDPTKVALQGEQAFVFVLGDVLPSVLASVLFAALILAQYLCGLATVTSASRMAFAFARDGGLPASQWIRHVSPRFRTPVLAIWSVAVASVLFTVYSPAYPTIAASAAVLLYISYVLPTAIGLIAFRRWWNSMGPWQLGRWFRPLAAVSVLGCGALVAIGLQPPNEKAAYVVGGMVVLLAILWFAVVRHHFSGPPHGELTQKQVEVLRNAEAAVYEVEQREGKSP
jgi:amino acid transporter